MTAKPNIRRMPNRWTRYTRKTATSTPLAAQPMPDSLSEDDRALIAVAKQRPVAPEVWREIQKRGLTCYV